MFQFIFIHFYHCWSFTFLPLPVIHIFTTAGHSHFYHCRSFTFLPLSFTFPLHQEHNMIFFSLSYISRVIQIFGIFKFRDWKCSLMEKKEETPFTVSEFSYFLPDWTKFDTFLFPNILLKSGNSLISGKLSSVNSDWDHVLEKVLQTWHYLHISRNSMN